MLESVGRMEEKILIIGYFNIIQILDYTERSLYAHFMLSIYLHTYIHIHAENFFIMRFSSSFSFSLFPLMTLKYV